MHCIKNITFFILLLLLHTFCGCSVLSDSHNSKQSMMQSYLNGDNEHVLDQVRKQLAEDSFFSTSAVGSGDELPWRLEAGSIFFHNGNFVQSLEEFRKAEKLIADFDDRPTVSIRDTAAAGSMLMTNSNTLPYRGYCRDRIALSFYKSLAYLGTGKYEAFRAQLRRMRSEHQKTVNDFKKLIAREEKSVRSVQQEYPAISQKAASAYKNMSGNSNNQIAADLQTMRRKAKIAGANMLNPAAIYLSGLSLVRDGAFDNARIEFQRLYSISPENGFFRKYLVTLLRKLDRQVPPELTAVESFDFPLDRNTLYVFAAVNRSAALKQVSMTLPVMIAVPICEYYPPVFTQAAVKADNKLHRLDGSADMDALFSQEFNARWNVTIMRIIISTLLKESAYYGALTAVSLAKMHSGTQALVLAGIAAGGAVYRSAVNTADTRSWESLPGKYFFTQLPMPRNREITLTLEKSNSKPWCKTVRIPDDHSSAIVFVSAPSEKNVNIHIFNMLDRK